MKYELKLIRVYDIRPETPGCRVLVDRLWPRGLRKEAIEPFFWAKNIAPSNELRKWFGHDPKLFREFTNKYLAELAMNPYAGGFIKQINGLLKAQDVILLFAAKSEILNHAVVLKAWLSEKIPDLQQG